MKKSKKKPREVSDLFASLGIDTSRPGFYDDPKFVAQERKDEAFLENYAAFVDTRQYPPDYLDRARQTITRLSTFLHERLVGDGRLGACVDLAMAMSRMLEREGIWNYIAKSALTTTFNPSLGLSTTYLAPITLKGNPATLAHAWLVAPPFRVVDLTISRQPMPDRYRLALPPLILSDTVKSARFDVHDLMDQPAVEEFVKNNGREPTLADLTQPFPGIVEHVRKLGCIQVDLAQITAKYTLYGITAPMEPLEEMESLVLSGKSPVQLYAEFRAPKD